MKRRVQASFLYDNDQYRLWVTDPIYERNYLQEPDNSYELGESYLIVSLGEPFQGNCYKLDSSILEGEKAN